MKLPKNTKVDVLTRRGDFSADKHGYWLCYSYYDKLGVYRTEVMPCFINSKKLWEFLKPFTRPL